MDSKYEFFDFLWEKEERNVPDLILLAHEPEIIKTTFDKVELNEFTNVDIKYIPENFKFYNDFIVTDYEALLEIKDGVKGDYFSFKHAGIEIIGDNINLKILTIFDSNLKKIGNGLQSEVLKIEHCFHFKEMGNNCKIDDLMIVKSKNFTKLGENIKADRIVIIDCENLKKLPNNIECEYLHLEKLNLTTFPKIKSGSMYIKNSKIGGEYYKDKLFNKNK